MTYGRLKSNIFSKSFRDIKNEGFIYFFIKTFRFFYHKYLQKNANRITKKLLKKQKEYFIFNNKKIPYLINAYNLSWMNERTIEIPIILELIKKVKAKRILEVGAVLQHYIEINWDVVDKFEKGDKRVLNLDIVDFKPKKKYDLILSISTLEHIGFDDENNPEKIISAIKNIKQILKKNGIFVATMPLGYNKYMDKLIFNKKIDFDEIYFMKRISRKNKWKQVNINEVKNVRYNYPYNNANAIVIAIYRNK
ncbi:MAG: hypothetical protein QXW97_00675 [Candidatus Pacearchaeota archaeon]